MKTQHKTRTPNSRRKSKLSRSGTAKPKPAKEIKKRNKTNMAITEHQHFHQKILDAEPGVVYIYDLEEHQNVYVNRHWLIAFGYTEEETKAMGSELLERICHPDDLPRIFVHYENWQQASQSDIREFEYRVQTKTGEWRWLHSREAAFMLNKVGMVKQILGSAYDITERKQAEEVIRQSEMEYRTLIDTMQEGLGVQDGNGLITFMNRRGCEMLGYTLEELVGKPVTFLFDEENQNILRDQMVRRRRGECQSFEITWLRKDGRKVDTLVTPNPRFDKEGKLVESVAVFTDITEHKRAAEELRASENRYALATKATNDVIWEWDLKTDELHWNENAQTMFGFTPEEIDSYQTWWEDRLHPEDRERVLSNLDALLTSGESNWLEEYRIARRDGYYAYIFDRGYVERDVSGKPLRMIGAMSDITTRKQAEEKLRESEARFRAMADFSPLGIFLTAPDGFSLYANAQNLDQMGLTEAEARGTGWQRAIHPDDLGIVFTRFGDAVRQGTAYEGTNRYLHADGTVVWVDVNAGPIRDGDRIIGYVGTVADITERKQAEEKVHRHINYLTALREIDQVITSTFDVQISLNTLISRAVSLLGVDAATILLLEPFTNSLKSAAEYGFRSIEVHTARVKLGESYAGRTFIERQMIQIPDLTNEPNNLFLTGFLKGEDFVSYYGIPLIVKGETIGVLEVFQRTFIDRNQEWFDFLTTLAGQAAIAIDHATLFENLKSSNRRLFQAYDATIEGWSRAMDLRDKETEGHTRRVTDLTVRLAIAMNIDEKDIVHIRRGALLHDIGKLGVPDHILLKSDKLTDEEWLIMRQHPVYAYNMLASVDYLHHALEIPYSHHEKWDGSGYPRGLKGLEIPLAARIFAVADVWDAITSDRPYRKGWSKADALEYIQEQSGTYFDPQVVDVFLNIIGTSTLDTSS